MITPVSTKQPFQQLKLDETLSKPRLEKEDNFSLRLRLHRAWKGLLRERKKSILGRDQIFFAKQPFRAEKTVPLCPDTIDVDWMHRKLAAYPRTHNGLELKLDVAGGDDWLPTPHGYEFAVALKDHPELFAGRHVVELGGGIGTQTLPILAAKPASLTITEISESRELATKRTLQHNAARLPSGIPVKHMIADWLRFPFRTDVLVAAPPFGMAGMPYRRHFIDSLIHLSRDALTDNGTLLFVQSSMADIQMSIQLLKEYCFDVQILREADYFWRSYYSRDHTFAKLAEQVQARTGGLAFEETEVDGAHRKVERLYVVMARKLAFESVMQH